MATRKAAPRPPRRRAACPAERLRPRLCLAGGPRWAWGDETSPANPSPRPGGCLGYGLLLLALLLGLGAACAHRPPDRPPPANGPRPPVLFLPPR